MANITTHPQTATPLFGFVRTTFAAIRDGLSAMIWANDAARQVDALMKLSDAELADRNLKRGTLAKHVFSDNFWT